MLSDVITADGLLGKPHEVLCSKWPWLVWISVGVSNTLTMVTLKHLV